MKKTQKLENGWAEKQIKREAMVEAGAYDGRFKTQVVKDKMKENDKNACRDFKY